MGPQDTSRARPSIRCGATTPAIRRRSSARSAAPSSSTTPGRSTTSTRCSRPTATGCRSAAPTSRSRRRTARVEAWGRSADNPVGGWYGLKKGLRGRFGVYMPPLMEALGLAELTHDAKNNRMRARSDAPSAAPLAAPGDPFDALGDPNRRAIVELLGAGRTLRPGDRRRPAHQPAGRLAPPAAAEARPAWSSRSRVGRVGSTGSTTRAWKPSAPTSSRSGATRATRFRLVAENTRPRRRATVIEPIRLAFDVECPADHAFDVWTRRIAQWWPADHTRRPAATASRSSLEGRPGGRIFERTPSGDRARLGRGHRLGAARPPRLPLAPQPRPRRRDRRRDPLRRPRATAPPGWRSSIGAGSGSAPMASRGGTATTAAGRRSCPTMSPWSTVT